MLEIGTRYVTFTKHDLGSESTPCNRVCVDLNSDEDTITLQPVHGGGFVFEYHAESKLFRLRTPSKLVGLVGTAWNLSSRSDDSRFLHFSKMCGGDRPWFRPAGELMIPSELLGEKVSRVTMFLPGEDAELFLTQGQLVVAVSSFKSRGEIGSNMRLLTMKKGVFLASRPMPALTTILKKQGLTYSDLCFYRMAPPSENRTFGTMVFVKGV